jgi:hypothetical protein
MPAESLMLVFTSGAGLISMSMVRECSDCTSSVDLYRKDCLILVSWLVEREAVRAFFVLGNDTVIRVFFGMLALEERIKETFEVAE